MSEFDNLCECEPGRFHPKDSHMENGCMVAIYNRGCCPCKKKY